MTTTEKQRDVEVALNAARDFDNALVSDSTASGLENDWNHMARIGKKQEFEVSSLYVSICGVLM